MVILRDYFATEMYDSIFGPSSAEGSIEPISLDNPPGRATLSTASRLKYLYLAYFSQPKADRGLYRLLRRSKIRRIVEMGIGTAIRSQRIIAVAQRYAADEIIHFTGIDRFEDRPEKEVGLRYKEAFKLFRKTGAKSQLLPGKPYDALQQFANQLTETDLILISADQDAASLAAAWFYVPRMLHADSLVFQETNADDVRSWKEVPRLEIERLAAAQKTARRRAA